MVTYKYTEERLREYAPKATSVRNLAILMGAEKPSGGTQNHLSKLLKMYNIDTSHFMGQAHRKGKAFDNEFKGASHYLVRLSKGVRRTSAKYLRRSLIEIGVEHKCSECGLGPEWNGKVLVLQIDHIDGDWYNNLRENLRFLCPNCHCQTETWGKRVSGEMADTQS